MLAAPMFASVIVLPVMVRLLSAVAAPTAPPMVALPAPAVRVSPCEPAASPFTVPVIEILLSPLVKTAVAFNWTLPVNVIVPFVVMLL